MTGYRKTDEIVGFAYEAALHCVACAQRRFGDRLWDDLDPPHDSEGNPVTPVFLGDVRPDDACDDCSALLAE